MNEPHRATDAVRDPRLLAAAAGGLLAGAGAELLAFTGAARWLDEVASYGALWVLLAGLIGRFAPSRPAGAVRATVFLLAMVVGYYVVFWRTIGVLTRFLWLWSTAAIIVGPVLGVCGRMSREANAGGLVAALTLAGLAGGEALLLVSRGGVDLWRPTFLVAAAASATFVLATPRRRLAATLLPLAATGGLLLLQGALTASRMIA